MSMELTQAEVSFLDSRSEMCMVYIIVNSSKKKRHYSSSVVYEEY